MSKHAEAFRLLQENHPKVFIDVNLSRERVLPCAKSVARFLKDLGVEPVMDESLCGIVEDGAARFAPVNEALPECDLMIVVGGDGTILRAAKNAIFYDKPILGINAGHLGFLSDLEDEEVAMLAKLTEGGCTVEKRMLLDVFHGKEKYTAVNDILVNKTEPGKIIDLYVTCDGREVSQYRADGVVLATPNGSTAYSMSAGGPVLDSRMDAIIMTPVCPHSLISRSIVFSPEKELGVRSRLVNSSDKLGVIVDGDHVMSLSADDGVTVKRSSKKVKFINITGRGFYEILNQKIIGRR